MYEAFYEMKHTPFTRSIPSDALYKTHQNAEVLSRLTYTAKTQLFAVLIGEPGTGKTSTLRRLKDELPETDYIRICAEQIFSHKNTEYSIIAKYFFFKWH